MEVKFVQLVSHDFGIYFQGLSGTIVEWFMYYYFQGESILLFWPAKPTCQTHIRNKSCLTHFFSNLTIATRQTDGQTSLVEFQSFNSHSKQ